MMHPNLSNFNVVMPELVTTRLVPITGGHIRNQGMVTHSGDYEGAYNMAMFPIPKNASSSIRGLVNILATTTKQNWSDPDHYIDLLNRLTREDLTPIDDIIVVLRDPYERFISACNMFITDRNTTGRLEIDGDTITILESHFYTQSWYLHDILENKKLLDKCRFFYMSNTDDVIMDIIKRFPLLPQKAPSFGHANKSVSVVTDVNKDLIEKIYSEDFDLIERTKFENSDNITFSRG